MTREWTSRTRASSASGIGCGTGWTTSGSRAIGTRSWWSGPRAGARLLDPELQRVLDWWEKAAPTRRLGPALLDDDGDFERAERCLRDSAAARDAALELERQRAEADRMNKERELAQAKALAEAQRQRAEDQAAAGVRQRRLNRVLVASLMAAVVALATAIGQKQEADNERELKLSQQLIAEAGSELEDGATQLALLFGAAGIRLDSSRQTPESRVPQERSRRPVLPTEPPACFSRALRTP